MTTVPAVGHVRRVKNHAIIQQRRAALVDVLQFLHHLRKHLRVPRMDLPAGFARNRVGVFHASGVALVLQRVAMTLVADRHEPADVPGVVPVHLVLALAARDLDLLRVDDDDEVAGVGVGRPGGLVFPLEDPRDARGHAAENLLGGVDEVPTGGRPLGRGASRGHGSVRSSPAATERARGLRGPGGE